MFTIDGDTLDNMEKRDLLDWVIRPALPSVPGVADVNALGGLVRVFAVKPDFNKLQAFEILLATLINPNDAAAPALFHRSNPDQNRSAGLRCPIAGERSLRVPVLRSKTDPA